MRRPKVYTGTDSVLNCINVFDRFGLVVYKGLSADSKLNIQIKLKEKGVDLASLIFRELDLDSDDNLNLRCWLRI